MSGRLWGFKNGSMVASGTVNITSQQSTSEARIHTLTGHLLSAVFRISYRATQDSVCWTCIWTRPSTFVPRTNATCQFVLLTNRCRRCHCHSRRCHCRPISIDRLAPAYASIRWIQMAAINELLQHVWMDLTPAPVSQSLLGLYRVGQKRRPTGKRETTNAAFRAIQAVEPYFIKDGSCVMMIYHSSQLGANCFANTKPTQAANVLHI